MDIRNEAQGLGQAILDAIVCYGEGDNVADVLCTLQDTIYDILTSKTIVPCWREDKSIPLPAYQTEGAACWRCTSR